MSGYPLVTLTKNNKRQNGRYELIEETPDELKVRNVLSKRASMETGSVGPTGLPMEQSGIEILKKPEWGYIVEGGRRPRRGKKSRKPRKATKKARKTRRRA